jgi:hypothetical protein
LKFEHDWCQELAFPNLRRRFKYLKPRSLQS